MSSNLHSVLDNSEIHVPKDFDTAPDNSYLTRNQLGGLDWADIYYLEPVLNRTPITGAPPTEITGDRYIVEGAGVPNPDWDGALINDVVEFDGISWVSLSAEGGMMCYSLVDGLLYGFSLIGVWTAIGGGGGGGVSSVGATGLENGLTLTALPSPIVGVGTITLGGTLAINDGDWSGTQLSVANGGTGSVTAQTAINTLSDVGSATAGDVLTESAGNVVWSAPIKEKVAIASSAFINTIGLPTTIVRQYCIGDNGSGWAGPRWIKYQVVNGFVLNNDDQWFGIPIPFDIPTGTKIKLCGNLVTTGVGLAPGGIGVDTLHTVVGKFTCGGGLGVTLIRIGTASSVGIACGVGQVFCFNNTFTTTAPFSACSDNLVVGFAENTTIITGTPWSRPPAVNRFTWQLTAEYS